MIWRLEEGNGTAFYQIGVLDSGQVTGLNDEELFETLIAIYYMASTLEPKAQVSIDKVRKGSSQGYSLQLKVVKKDACKDSQRFLMSYSEE